MKTNRFITLLALLSLTCGWYDASGDVSKYIGALNESNDMNVQESPMAVWCFLQSADLLRQQKSQPLRTLIPMLTEEALYGADFVIRMQDPSGYFHTSVFDGCTKDPARREICAFKGLSHTKNGETQAGFREGGGMAIAALARISTLNQSGDYTPVQYLALERAVDSACRLAGPGPRGRGGDVTLTVAGCFHPQLSAGVLLARGCHAGRTGTCGMRDKLSRFSQIFPNKLATGGGCGIVH